MACRYVFVASMWTSCLDLPIEVLYPSPYIVYTTACFSSLNIVYPNVTIGHVTVALACIHKDFAIRDRRDVQIQKPVNELLECHAMTFSQLLSFCHVAFVECLF